jgi:hypothetical protein
MAGRSPRSASTGAGLSEPEAASARWVRVLLAREDT